MAKCVKEIKDLELYKHYTGIIKDNQFKIFNGNSHYSSVKNSKSYPLDCFELVGIQDRDGWITTVNRVNLSEFNKEKDMEIDRNDPFMQVLEYLLGTEYENTITKLESEERKDSTMKEEVKSMKTLEACDYLLNHEGEYLIAKDNENFELHFDGKQFETHYKAGENMGINKLTLDFSTLSTKWIIPIKKKTYRISGYVKIVDSKNLVYSDSVLLSDKERDGYIQDIQNALWNKYKYTGGSVLIEYESMFDENLNAITKVL